MAEELAAKYGFPLEIVRVAIIAETDEDEEITENERVDRIKFLMKVMDLLEKKTQYSNENVHSNLQIQITHFQ